MECKHKFKVLDVVYLVVNNGSYGDKKYSRNTTYFCKKCLFVKMA